MNTTIRSFLNVTVVALAPLAIACGTAATPAPVLPQGSQDHDGIADASEVEMSPEFQARYAQLVAEQEGNPVQAGDSRFVADERKHTPRAAEVKKLAFSDRNTSCVYTVKDYSKVGTFATAEEAETAFQSWINKQPCSGKECDTVAKATVIMDCDEDRLAKFSSR